MEQTLLGILLLLVAAVVVELLALMLMVVMVEQPMVMVEEVLPQEPLEGQEMDLDMQVVQDLQVAHQDMGLVLVAVLAVLVVMDLTLDKQQLLVVLEHQIAF
jgi:hypothetical protein